jgi:hypothetical protein
MTIRASAIVFWIGLLFAALLSAMLMSALAAFGFQPSPVGLRVLALFLLAYPWVLLVARPWVKNRTQFDYSAGAFMLTITVGYVIVMNVLNP